MGKNGELEQKSQEDMTEDNFINPLTSQSASANEARNFSTSTFIRQFRIVSFRRTPADGMARLMVCLTGPEKVPLNLILAGHYVSGESRLSSYHTLVTSTQPLGSGN